MTRARQHLIAAMANAGYLPFKKSGHAVEANVTEDVREQELPRAQPLTIPASLDSVRIKLSRNGCYKDSCANYSVTVDGDGHVRYEGTRGPTHGVHDSTIPVARVRQLLEAYRQSGLWGARSEYRSPRWDQPTFVLEVSIGDETRKIVDVAGEGAGLPVAAREFQDEVDRVAETDTWTKFTMEAVRRLQAEGFDFKSKDGSDLLGRLFFHGGGNEDVFLRLLELGVPADSVREVNFRGVVSRTTPFEDAISLGYERLMAELIARGALLKDGKLDPGLVDEAFAQAIGAGRLGPVKVIWNSTTASSRPSFSEPARGPGSDAAKSTEPVIVRLHHDPSDGGWQGLEVVQWFADVGGDLKARSSSGRNLLQIAVQANDEPLVRFLLDEGLDPSQPGEYQSTPLEDAADESIALLLLERGAKTRKDPLTERDYLDEVKGWKWTNVVRWLESHPQ
jgi:hypothetical protein